MNWFQRLTGFEEINYDDTRGKLEIEGSRLRSLVNGKSYGIGELELVSLQSLRDRVRSTSIPQGRWKVTNVTGDVQRLHRDPEYGGALFQVASQFNLLEMTGPNVRPEHGVARYKKRSDARARVCNGRRSRDRRHRARCGARVSEENRARRSAHSGAL